MHLYQLVDHLFNRCLVDRILAVSFDLRNYLARSYGSQRVICVHNGIDLEQVQACRPVSELRRELNVGANFVIGTMGRLVPVKGLEVFLTAARIIRDQKQHVKFVIVGDGPLKETLQALACHSGLEQDILFLGHRDDSYDVLAMMDLFVLPSFSEGIPMVLLEALALARPVIASRVGGIPEVVEDRVSGWLVEPGREEQLAEACLALMEDYETAKRFAVAGQQCVRERFSVSAMAENVADVYRSLIDIPRS
jgi:glycosyltransferase involved in cell wall biosynthesis